MQNFKLTCVLFVLFFLTGCSNEAPTGTEPAAAAAENTLAAKPAEAPTAAEAANANEDTVLAQVGDVYSPYVGQSHPDRVYRGESHLHTSYSWDAELVGDTLGPDDAYRFAKGQQVMASSGQPVKLVRPLDWLVVADHAESLGVAVLVERSDPAILKSKVGRKTHDLYKKGEIHEAFETWGLNVIVKGDNPLTDENLTRSVWEEIVDHAEAHNQPGAFTAFIGYEWSSAPGGNNLHRVVVMRDGGDEAKQVTPFASYDSDDPEDLWQHGIRGCD